MEQELEKTLKALLNLSEDELLIQIGEQLALPSLGMAGQSERKSIKQAKQWLSENSAKLKEQICNSHVVQIYLTNKKRYDDISLAAAILDLIVDIVIDITPATVAVLIIKKGIASLCSDTDNSEDDE